MNVKELIELLSTVDDKTLTVATYDGLGEVSGIATCVAIETKEKHLYDGGDHVLSDAHGDFYGGIDKVLTIVSEEPRYVVGNVATMITPPQR